MAAHAKKHLVPLQDTLGFLGLTGFLMKDPRFPDEDSIGVLGFQGLGFLRKFLVDVLLQYPGLPVISLRVLTFLLAGWAISLNIQGARYLKAPFWTDSPP